jgi:CheY-like chemotaxis protein
MMATVLAAHGATVRVAASAEEALAAVRQEVPDVLLSDIGMPGKDGYALIREIREWPTARGGSVPAAAITAFVREEDRAAALAAGFDAHVPKPIHAVSLLRTVVALAAPGGQGGGR